MPVPRILFDDATAAAADHLIVLALAEDLQDVGDLTCLALVDADETGAVQVTARQTGVLAGGPIAEAVFRQYDSTVNWQSQLADGEAFTAGTVVATVTGSLRSLLSGERTALNFLTHLCGIATLTRQYVDAVAATTAQILDTRKTHPGYRLLEKYAVRCGGGQNHRMGLYDGCMIKDNHLAGWSARHPGENIATAINQAREQLVTLGHGSTEQPFPIEVEVDTLAQLRDVLVAEPEIVLLDNMPPEQLREAVEIRNQLAPRTQLEASGGVNLQTVREIAGTGVERISVGALTHSAIAVDLGFDWSA